MASSIGRYGNPAISSYVIDAAGYYVATNVEATLTEIYETKNPTNQGYLSGFAVTDEGGLNISWTAGTVFDFNNQQIVVVAAGDGACATDLVNYLYWDAGGTLAIGAVHPTGNQVLVAEIYCQSNDIFHVMEMGALDRREHWIVSALDEIFPNIVTNGLTVTEDPNVVNIWDVQMAAGNFFHHARAEHTIAAIVYSRITAMRRWYHAAGAWISDTNAEIDITQYDNGANLVGVTAAKYHRSVFFTDGTIIHWVYPQAEYATVAAAIDAPDPTLPPGLLNLPKLTAVIIQTGDAAFPAVGSDQWVDVRPMIGQAIGAPISDHGGLSGLADDDHLQYLLIDGTRAMTGNLTFVGAQTVDGVDISAISLSNMPAAAAGNIDCGAQAITNVGNVDGVDVSAIVAFTTITGITNDVVADALTDTLTLASANAILTIVGTAATDTITFTIDETVISHDAVADVSADDHHAQSHTIASHSDATLADPEADQIVFWDDSDSKFEFLVANTGLSIVDNNLNCDITQYTDGLARTACLEDDVYGAGWDADVTHAPTQNAVYDKIAAMDILIAANTTVVEVEAVITAEIVGGQSIDNAIDALINTHNAADTHVAHSGVTITAGVGLSGGGTIAASRTIDCDITQYTDGLARTACLEDDVYGVGWDADVTHAPTQNAVYDKIAAMDILIAANTTPAEAIAAVVAENPLTLTNGLTIGSIAQGVADYDKFLVSHGGIVKFRNEAECRSDLDVYSEAETDSAIDIDVNAHQIQTNIHHPQSHVLTTHTDMVMTGPYLEDITMFGSANASWVNCPVEGVGAYTWGQMNANNIMTNLGADNMDVTYAVPLATNRGGLKLYIIGTRVILMAASINDYVNNTLVVGFTGSARSVRDTDPTNKNSGGEHDDSFGALDCSAYDIMKASLDCVNTNSGDLDISGVLVLAYYAP